MALKLDIQNAVSMLWPKLEKVRIVIWCEECKCVFIFWCATIQFIFRFFQISKKKAAEQMLDHLRSLPPLASYSNTEEEEEEEEAVPAPVAAPQKAPAKPSAQASNGVKQKKAPPAAASNATTSSPEAAVNERNYFSWEKRQNISFFEQPFPLKKAGRGRPRPRQEPQGQEPRQGGEQVRLGRLRQRHQPGEPPHPDPAGQEGEGAGLRATGGEGGAQEEGVRRAGRRRRRISFKVVSEPNKLLNELEVVFFGGGCM